MVRSHFVLTSSIFSCKIYILGECVRKLIDTREEKHSYISDMQVKGDTLIVPRSIENTVLYYKLRNDSDA